MRKAKREKTTDNLGWWRQGMATTSHFILVVSSVDEPGFFLVGPRKKTQGEKTQEFRNSSKKLKLKPKSALFGIFVEKI